VSSVSSEPPERAPALELMGEEPVDGVLSNDELVGAAANGLRWIAYSRIGIELLLLFSMVFLARLIPPAAFGVFAVIIVVQELSQSMPMEGIGGALVQRKAVGRRHLQAGFAVSLTGGLLLTALTIGLSFAVVGPIFGEETKLLMIATAPCFILGAIYALPISVLRRRLDFRRMSMLEIVMNMFRAFGTLALALVGLDAPALVFGSMSGVVAGCVLALWFAPVPLPRWHRKEAKELFPYAWPAATATVSWAGFRNGDYAVIAATLGSAAAGIYWRAYQLAVEYQRKITVAMTQIAFPVLSRTAGAEERLVLRQRMVRLLTVVLFPLLALLVLLAPVLVPWLFGPEWEAAVVPTQILVAGGAATLVIDACGSALMAVGRTKALLGYGVAHFIVYVGAVAFLVHLGLPAVAIGGAVIHSVFLGVAYILMLGDDVEHPLLTLWQDLEPALVSCIALAALALPANWALVNAGVPVVPHALGTAAAAAVGYLLALRIGYPAQARDLGAALRRILPDRLTRRFRRHPRPRVLTES
jgi:O-antigen/teichoic acid export membrane protein